MYSQKTVNENLEVLEAREGWRPVYHSVDEVNEFKKYIESLVKIESSSKSSYVTLSKSISYTKQEEIRRWIVNEQLLCWADYGYWESRYAFIADETGAFIKFTNRKSQEVFDSVIADLDEKGLSKEILAFSARQAGIGIKVLLRIAHRLLFRPHSTALIADPILSRSEYIGKNIDVIYNCQPWWLVPIKNPKGKFNNGSVLSIEAGFGNRLSQGFTPQYVYVSGIGDIPNPVKVLEEGLMRAMQTSAQTFLVLHGSVENVSEYLRNLWQYSKQYYPSGKSRFLPLFIPWPVCTDIYPTSAWSKKYPVPPNWVPLRETKEHVGKCEKYIREASYLAKVMGKNYKMPVEQQWYWESEYLEAKHRQILDSWEARMPADDSCFAPSVSDDIDFDLIFPSAAEIQKKASDGKKVM